MTQEYWFARRFPVSDARRSMAPISRKGVRIALVFVAAMLGGAALGALIALGGWLPAGWPAGVIGWAVFIAAAIWGAWYFIAQAAKHGDPRYTVADYKAGRVPGRRYME